MKSSNLKKLGITGLIAGSLLFAFDSQANAQGKKDQNTNQQTTRQNRSKQQKEVRARTYRQVNPKRQVRPPVNQRGIDQMPGRNQSWTRSQQQQVQRRRLQTYNLRWNNWQNLRRQRELALQNQHRSNYLRYQQSYWDRLRRDQLRLQQAVYYDNIVNNYRYNRGGIYYYTNPYGAQMLRDALNYGYEQGFEAGQADRADGWGFNYESAYAYQDGSYGYDSYYVGLDEYSYYFRQGFRRGYEDGYYGRYQYGIYSNGRYSILGSLIGTILDFVIG